MPPEFDTPSPHTTSLPRCAGLHRPGLRKTLAKVDGFEVLGFDSHTRQFQDFAQKGLLHLQLFNQKEEISILTPSPLTDGHFEALTPEEGRIAARCYPALAHYLGRSGVLLPPVSRVMPLLHLYLMPYQICLPGHPYQN